ncbi:nicotinamide mononucleotide transporter [Malaciobacter pacificus]|uniref:Nicotinamide riboside transporter PnuC n=1 Tax=Malaciobacter pacificus TaxID=1080223 RepID=A0A5C2HD05_9BACT|nr:nicotinamide riboside transporter PnuC [Malaciobacter pacificus]QEP34714.1 nicotinamide mononucleotide transporter [Malaciobacter pacificus]GGD46339.1 nicotinamide mononucleotide transporter [Malaciobacter pacificus]
MEFLQTVIESLNIMSTYEAIAMVLAIAYILLAIKQSLWCWPAAFVSTLIYTILFYDVSLLMDSALNAYYLIMAVYGWYSWKYGGKLQEVDLEVSTYGLNKNIQIIAILTIISLAFGYVMANYTSADFAYVDSFTTVFAVFSTYMLAKKIIENWIYWIVIDVVSIYIYIQKGLNLTAVLFMIYTILALVAYLDWKKEFDLKKSKTV